MDEGFRTFDHTGDLGLEVWAASPERLFARAALAVLAQVAETRAHESEVPEVEIRFARSAPDPADLLVDLCNTALLEAEVGDAIWTAARIVFAPPGRLEATFSGYR